MRHDLRGLFRGAAKAALELVLEEMVAEIVGAGRYKQAESRIDRRNGSYLRRLLTSMGAIDVRVPRTRNHGSPTDVLGRYQRRTAEVDDAIVSAYVNGVSTRGMSDVTEALMGESVSRSSVSRVTRVLEEQIEQLRKAPIDEPIAYLYLDATFLDARWARKVESVAALVAYGVGPDGKRRLLAVTIGAQESEDSWNELFEQLIRRGLTGVRLVITDEHRGLVNAVRTHLPEVPRQRCTVHFTRNVWKKAPRRLQPRVAREVSKLFNAKNRQESKKLLKSVLKRFTKQLPEAMGCLADGFKNATVFYDFPPEHWQRIRNTNGLERLHGEIKRRTKSVGAFPDRMSALRLVTAVAIRTTNLWAERRYLDVSLLDQAEEDQTHAA
jgi:transposase-like protein